LTVILVCVLSAYLAALLYLAVNQRRIIYHPDPSPAVLTEDAQSLGFTQVEIEAAAGLRLAPWYRPAGPDEKTIVYFHGNAGNLGHRIDRVRGYADAGYGVLLVAYRGYGGNSGDPTEDGLYADGRAHIAWLASQGIAERNLVYYGESLGAAIALQLAIERPPAGLVLEAPFASILASARSRFPMFAFDWLIKDKFPNIDKIGALRAPLLVIHGARDGVTAFRFGQQIFAAAPEPKFALWLAEAGHGDLVQHGSAERVIQFLDWIEGPGHALAPGQD
jgi:fermentation-respiration switch protein FrsA (DUF1100 family)